MRIKKVINNNILCAIDEKGHELIVTGRGIGFQRHRGERIDSAVVERTYRMEGKDEQKRLRELVEQIPFEHLQLTEKLIDEIRQQIPQALNEMDWRSPVFCRSSFAPVQIRNSIGVRHTSLEHRRT